MHHQRDAMRACETRARRFLRSMQCCTRTLCARCSLCSLYGSDCALADGFKSRANSNQPHNRHRPLQFFFVLHMWKVFVFLPQPANSFMLVCAEISRVLFAFYLVSALLRRVYSREEVHFWTTNTWCLYRNCKKNGYFLNI